LVDGNTTTEEYTDIQSGIRSRRIFEPEKWATVDRTISKRVKNIFRTKDRDRRTVCYPHRHEGTIESRRFFSGSIIMRPTSLGRLSLVFVVLWRACFWPDSKQLAQIFGCRRCSDPEQVASVSVMRPAGPIDSSERTCSGGEHSVQQNPEQLVWNLAKTNARQKHNKTKDKTV